MSDMLIRGMEMPSCCMFCPISNATGCGLMNPPVLMTSKEMLQGRPDWCPLLSVPPHGRVIDADALTVKLQRHREYHSDGSKSGAAISNGIGQCLDIINGKECPTIIPTEEVKES